MVTAPTGKHHTSLAVHFSITTTQPCPKGDQIPLYKIVISICRNNCGDDGHDDGNGENDGDDYGDDGEVDSDDDGEVDGHDDGEVDGDDDGEVDGEINDRQQNSMQVVYNTVEQRHIGTSHLLQRGAQSL